MEYEPTFYARSPVIPRRGTQLPCAWENARTIKEQNAIADNSGAIIGLSSDQWDAKRGPKFLKKSLKFGPRGGAYYMKNGRKVRVSKNKFGMWRPKTAPFNGAPESIYDRPVDTQMRGIAPLRRPYGPSDNYAMTMDRLYNPDMAFMSPSTGPGNGNMFGTYLGRKIRQGPKGGLYVMKKGRKIRVPKNKTPSTPDPVPRKKKKKGVGRPKRNSCFGSSMTTPGTAKWQKTMFNSRQVDNPVMFFSPGIEPEHHMTNVPLQFLHNKKNQIPLNNGRVNCKYGRPFGNGMQKSPGQGPDNVGYKDPMLMYTGAGGNGYNWGYPGPLEQGYFPPRQLNGNKTPIIQVESWDTNMAKDIYQGDSKNWMSDGPNLKQVTNTGQKSKNGNAWSSTARGLKWGAHQDGQYPIGGAVYTASDSLNTVLYQPPPDQFKTRERTVVGNFNNGKKMKKKKKIQSRMGNQKIIYNPKKKTVTIKNIRK